MKYILTILMLATCPLVLKAQVIVEDATGKSSVVSKNAGIATDIGAAAVSVSYNNLRNAKVDRDLRLLWGLDLRGELTDGFSKLVSGGDVTTGSRLSGFFGMQFIPFTEVELKKTYYDLQKKVDDLIDAGKMPDSSLLSSLNAASKDYKTYLDNTPDKRWIVYASPSLIANTFRRYDSTAVGDLKNRYFKEKFRGAGITGGVNYTYAGKWTFGVALGIEKTNTIDSLEDRKSTVRSTILSGSQTIINDKEYTVKDGTYAAYSRLNLATDVIFRGKVDSLHRFSWNILYMRWYKPITKKDVVNNVVVLGTGINLYKYDGKFAGGIYLQCSDVGNKVSNEPSVYKRLDFGLTVKYTFRSIFNPSKG